MNCNLPVTMKPIKFLFLFKVFKYSYVCILQTEYPHIEINMNYTYHVLIVHIF